ncbi:hypothetical protein ABZ721_08850 [Streptomyces sp. NPDC006733]|uniref:hypothetical protein n=1 Tax=Streptomyces sp. NPDC006733 TaxID=3155460 RepID=UPI003406BD39
MTRRMLLFAALLFGILTMHTVGHPAGGEHEGMPRPAVAQAAVHEGTGMTSPAAMPPSHAAHPSHPAPAHGMNPLAVCLAVLGSAAAVLLTALGLAAALPSAAVGAARSALPRSRWLWPPAPRIPLSRLPVLRI